MKDLAMADRLLTRIPRKRQKPGSVLKKRNWDFLSPRQAGGFLLGGRYET